MLIARCAWQVWQQKGGDVVLARPQGSLQKKLKSHMDLIGDFRSLCCSFWSCVRIVNECHY